jgi:hypothetical protein
MDFKLPDGGSIRLLAPFADMLNHSPDAQQCHTYDPASGNLSVLAGKDYDAGDQVCLPHPLTLLVSRLTNGRVLRSLSITDLSQTIVCHVSMDSSYPTTLMKVTILFSQRIPLRQPLTKSKSSGYRPGLTSPPQYPSR